MSALHPAWHTSKFALLFTGGAERRVSYHHLSD
jgi:hypothetical protein